VKVLGFASGAGAASCFTRIRLLASFSFTVNVVERSCWSTFSSTTIFTELFAVDTWAHVSSPVVTEATKVFSLAVTLIVLASPS